MPLTTHSDSEDEDDFDYVPPADGISVWCELNGTLSFPYTEHDSDSADEQDKGDDSNAPGRPETDPAEQKK
jgi:hypothetical protein